jgi:hypothetical protein
MLASNQPYQRVDDGIGAGVVGGAVIGGAAVYGARKGIQAGMTHSMNKGMNAFDSEASRSSAITPTKYTPEGGAYQDIADRKATQRANEATARQRQTAGINAMNDSKWGKTNEKFFGGKDQLYKTNIHPAIDGVGKMNRRTAITAGLGVLAGSMIGGAIDGMNG